MGELTKIQWCHHTFNGWIGCHKISPGCKFCYAEVDTFARSRRGQGIELWGKGAPRHRTSAAYWRKPLAWDRAAREAGERHRVFTASLGDVFEDRDDLTPWRADLLGLIASTPNLDWLLLTKRPDNVMPALLGIVREYTRTHGNNEAFRAALAWRDGSPPPNVWLGTSVEDQQRADERIPHLLQIPARVRFLSVEPLLGPVDLMPWIGHDQRHVIHRRRAGLGYERSFLHWIICGGESGPHARPCDVAWIRSIVGQCKAAGTACFVKQLGAVPWDASQWLARMGIGDTNREYNKYCRIRLKDPKGGDIDEFPADLRVREWPDAMAKMEGD